MWKNIGTSGGKYWVGLFFIHGCFTLPKVPEVCPATGSHCSHHQRAGPRFHFFPNYWHVPSPDMMAWSHYSQGGAGWLVEWYKTRFSSVQVVLFASPWLPLQEWLRPRCTTEVRKAAADETMVQCEVMYFTIMHKYILVCWSAHVACATARGGIFQQWNTPNLALLLFIVKPGFKVLSKLGQ